MRFGAALLLLLTAGMSAGCARNVQISARPLPHGLAEDSPFYLPGLSNGDAWLRYHLIRGDPAGALEIFESPADRPTSDALLLALHEAVVRRQAGEFDKSNELLEWADQEAERRYVRSLSRTAASFLVSDRALSYTPTATERSMVPYYRMMNYLDLGDADGAAVEARRMSALLSESRGSDLRRCRGDAMLNQLAGLVFEKAGEWNDAIVSLRRASDDYAACASDGLIAPDAGLPSDLIRVASTAGLNELADSLRQLHPEAGRALSADSAEVILFVERGFIAHRAEEALHVPIFPDELDGVESDDDDRIGEIAANAIARLANNAGERARWGRSWDDDPGVQVAQAMDGAHILRLAWPTIRAAEIPASSSGARLLVGGLASELTGVGDLSALALAELEAERPAMLARLVTRSLAKYLLSREVEKKAEKQGGELMGFLAGRLMNFAANETERADTRSWTLLPAEIQIVRRRVGMGEVVVNMEVGESTASDAASRAITMTGLADGVQDVPEASFGVIQSPAVVPAPAAIGHAESEASQERLQESAESGSRQLRYLVLRAGPSERKIAAMTVPESVRLLPAPAADGGESVASQ